jgi:hypothetical protein
MGFVMKIKALLLGAVLASLSTVGAHAGTPVFSPATTFGPADYQAGLPVNLGMVFTVNSNTEATALGFYDIPDLTDSEDVGLYDSSGDLLASVTVSRFSPLTGGYHFLPIAPVALIAGDTYTVDAQVNDNPWQYGTLAPTPPQITFDNNSYLYSSSLAFPTNTGGSGPAYFGPNLIIGAPEPTSWALMLMGFGALGATMRIARRKSAVAA